MQRRTRRDFSRVGTQNIPELHTGCRLSGAVRPKLGEEDEDLGTVSVLSRTDFLIVPRDLCLNDTKSAVNSGMVPASC